MFILKQIDQDILMQNFTELGKRKYSHIDFHKILMIQDFSAHTALGPDEF